MGLGGVRRGLTDREVGVMGGEVEAAVGVLGKRKVVVRMKVGEDVEVVRVG